MELQTIYRYLLVSCKEVSPLLFMIVLDYAMRQAIEGKEQELGFTLYQRQSGRAHAKAISDIDFADDIALLANDIDKTRMLVNRVEEECKKVGFEINA